MKRKRTDANFAGRAERHAPQLGLKSMIKFLIEFSWPAGEMDISTRAQTAGAAEHIPDPFQVDLPMEATYLMRKCQLCGRTPQLGLQSMINWSKLNQSTGRGKLEEEETEEGYSFKARRNSAG